MTKHRLHVEGDDEDTMTVTHIQPGPGTRTATAQALVELLNNFKTLVDGCTYDHASQKKFWIIYYSGDKFTNKNLSEKNVQNVVLKFLDNPFSCK